MRESSLNFKNWRLSKILKWSCVSPMISCVWIFGLCGCMGEKELCTNLEFILSRFHFLKSIRVRLLSSSFKSSFCTFMFMKEASFAYLYSNNQTGNLKYQCQASFKGLSLSFIKISTLTHLPTWAFSKCTKAILNSFKRPYDSKAWDIKIKNLSILRSHAFTLK